MSIRRTKAGGSGDTWLATTGTGAALLCEEQQQVRQALDSIFGDQLLQIGVWGKAGLFRSFARTRYAATLAGQAVPDVDLVCPLNELAIADDSVDAVLLPHTLEWIDDPHGVLREVDRVLRPDGHVVVLGFNPLGSWGIRHYASRRRFPAGLSRMIAEYRLRDWLRLLNFTVQPATFYNYTAPVYRRLATGHVRQSGPGTGWQSGVPAVLYRLSRSLVFAGCYITVARKDVFTLTAIRPAFGRRRPRLVGGLVNPTSRIAA